MKTIQIAVAAGVLALAGPGSAAGSASTGSTTAQEREAVRAQVHGQLTTQGGVSEQDAKDFDGEVSDHAAHPGYGPAISKAIQADLAAGCKGTCLAADIHGINGAIDKGATPDEAAKMVTDRVAHATGKPSDPDARSDDQRQDAAHRDAASDRAHDASMGHGSGGGHGMGSGHH